MTGDDWPKTASSPETIRATATSQSPIIINVNSGEGSHIEILTRMAKIERHNGGQAEGRTDGRTDECGIAKRRGRREAGGRADGRADAGGWMWRGRGEGSVLLTDLARIPEYLLSRVGW